MPSSRHRRNGLTDQRHWDTLNPTGVSSSTYTATKKTVTCPSSTSSGTWTIDGNIPLPTIEDLVIRTRSLPKSRPSTPTTTNRNPVQSTGNSIVSSATSRPIESTSALPHSNALGLPTSSKAAIGVVVPLIAIASAGLLVLIWWRKQRAMRVAKQQQAQLQTTQGDDPWARKELGGGEISQLHSDNLRNEVDGRTRYRLPDEAVTRSELAGCEPPELPSSPSIPHSKKNVDQPPKDCQPAS